MTGNATFCWHRPPPLPIEATTRQWALALSCWPACSKAWGEGFLELGAAGVAVAAVHPTANRRTEHRGGYAGAMELEQALGHHQVGAGVPIREREERPLEGIDRMVKGFDGRQLGTLVAQVALNSIVPIDTALRLPNGARMQVLQGAERRSLLPTFAPDSELDKPPFTSNSSAWLAVHRNLSDPSLDLILAAPLAAYVQPFERAARTRVLVIAVVALLALVLTGFITTRLTGSLERLALAAEAVSAGDLEHRVDGNGSQEVGRVAAAFNSMMESLRRTLRELAQRQALAAVGEYAASLSHELRNGLTAIRVDLQRVEEGTARPEALLS